MSVIQKFDESVKPNSTIEVPAIQVAQQQQPVVQAPGQTEEGSVLVPPELPDLELPDTSQAGELPGLNIKPPSVLPGTPDADFQYPDFSEIQYEIPQTLNWNPTNIPRAPKPSNVSDRFLTDSIQNAIDQAAGADDAFNPLSLRFGESGKGLLGAIVYGITLPFNSLLGTSADLGRLGAAVEAGRRAMFDPRIVMASGGAAQAFAKAFAEQGRLTDDGSGLTFFQQALRGRQFSFSDPGYNEKGRLSPFGRTLEMVFGIDKPRPVETLKETGVSKRLRALPYVDALSGIIGIPVEKALQILGNEPQIKLPKLSAWVADRAKQVEQDQRQFWKSFIGLGLDVIVESATFELGAAFKQRPKPSLPDPTPVRPILTGADTPLLLKEGPEATLESIPVSNTAVVPYTPRRVVARQDLGISPEISTFELEEVQKAFPLQEDLLLLPPGEPSSELVPSWKALPDEDLEDLAENIDIPVDEQFIDVDPNQALLNGTFEELAQNADTLPQAKYIWARADNKVSFLRQSATNDAILASLNMSRSLSLKQFVKGFQSASKFAPVTGSEVPLSVSFPRYEVPNLNDIPQVATAIPSYYGAAPDPFVTKVNSSFEPYVDRQTEIQRIQASATPDLRGDDPESLAMVLQFENALVEAEALGSKANSLTSLADDFLNASISDVPSAIPLPKVTDIGYVVSRRTAVGVEPGDVVWDYEGALRAAAAPVPNPLPDVQYDVPRIYEVRILGTSATTDDNVIQDISKIEQISSKKVSSKDSALAVSVADTFAAKVDSRIEEAFESLKLQTAIELTPVLESVNDRFMEAVEKLDKIEADRAARIRRIEEKAASVFARFEEFINRPTLDEFTQFYQYVDDDIYDYDDMTERLARKYETIEEAMIDGVLEDVSSLPLIAQQALDFQNVNPEIIFNMYSSMREAIYETYKARGQDLPIDLLPFTDELCL